MLVVELRTQAERVSIGRIRRLNTRRDPHLTIGFLLTFIFQSPTNGPKYVRSEHWTATPNDDVTQLTNKSTQFDT